jgi:hypothetical protein
MNFKSGAKARPTTPGLPSSAETQRDPAFGGPVMSLQGGFGRRLHGVPAEHLWCRQCMRAFPSGTYRQVGDVRRCPYAGCDGHSVVDALDWAIVRGRNAEYPCTPLFGTKYALGEAAPVRRELSP